MALSLPATLLVNSNTTRFSFSYPVFPPWCIAVYWRVMGSSITTNIDLAWLSLINSPITSSTIFILRSSSVMSDFVSPGLVAGFVTISLKSASAMP